jgi:hypothetical protein
MTGDSVEQSYSSESPSKTNSNEEELYEDKDREDLVCEDR